MELKHNFKLQNRRQKFIIEYWITCSKNPRNVLGKFHDQFPDSYSNKTWSDLDFGLKFIQYINLHNVKLMYVKSSPTQVSKFERTLFNCNFFCPKSVLRFCAVFAVFIVPFFGFKIVQSWGYSVCAALRSSTLGAGDINMVFLPAANPNLEFHN